MSRKIYLFAMLCICIMSVGRASAQCSGGRYLNEIFSYTLDSTTYSTPYSLKMDIYQPAGDTLSARPLIILAHGGSFVGGTRSDDSTVDWLCQNFARRGYVTASIDYRLSNLVTMALDSSAAIDEVIKAISDGKAAVRYFVQDRATTNTYKIDTNNIYVGGNSAGAVLYMHVGYISNIGECPADVVTAMTANGGFDGNSGNAGYSLKCKAVIDLAGGLNTPSFVNAGDIPSVNAQGDADNVVPYTCAHALSGGVQVTLCGLGSLEPVFTSNSIYHWSHVFPGDGHVPWSSNPAKFFTVDSLVKQFLYTLVCPGASEVNMVNTNAEVLVYPNPASEAITIKASDMLKELSVYDQTGRVVFLAANINRDSYEVNTSHLPAGVYFVKIRFSNENTSPVIRQLVIE